MNDVELLAMNVQCLVNGWRERVEYNVKIGKDVEARAKTMRHVALILQLQEMSLTQSSGSGGPSVNRPDSRPPGNMAPLHLIDTISEQARFLYADLCADFRGVAPQDPLLHQRITQVLHNLLAVSQVAIETHPRNVHQVARTSSQWVRKARCMLGYDKPQVLLRDMVCGNCGGALCVASDASTDVRCIGTPALPSCGQVYARWDWLNLLRDTETGGTSE